MRQSQTKANWNRLGSDRMIQTEDTALANEYVRTGCAKRAVFIPGMKITMFTREFSPINNT